MCMNGTALYEGVTVLFLAQVFGVALDLGTQIVVLVLSVITAVGAAGVPGGSLPLLMVVLATVGVPPQSIAIDRKSTRLNSSHGYISYAVFCLKKKKNKSKT